MRVPVTATHLASVASSRLHMAIPRRCCRPRTVVPHAQFRLPSSGHHAPPWPNHIGLRPAAAVTRYVVQTSLHKPSESVHHTPSHTPITGRPIHPHKYGPTHLAMSPRQWRCTPPSTSPVQIQPKAGPWRFGPTIAILPAARTFGEPLRQRRGRKEVEVGDGGS